MAYEFAALLDNIEACRFCYMCVPACEVAAQTRLDVNTPRAIALTLFRVQQGKQAFDERVADILYQCTTCGACRDWCISHYDVPGYVRAARVDAAALGLAPGPPAVTTRPTLRGTEPTAYWAGAACEYDSLREAMQRLATAADGTWGALVGNGPCLGELAALGYPEQARGLALSAMAAIDPRQTSTLVVGCAACRQVLGPLAPEGLRVVGLAEHLAERVAAGRLRFAERSDLTPVAVHEGCTADASPAGRRLLKASGVPVVELKTRGPLRPQCGAAGGLPRTNPELARTLGLKLLENARAAGARAIVCDSPACVANLRAAGSSPPVLHLAEFLADRTVG